MLEQLGRIAVRAGVPVMEIYRGARASRAKSDGSPVTDADLAAEELILRELAELAPGTPVVAEESVAAGRCPDVGSEYFLVDPLDGTREFTSGTDEFTVNIAFLRDGVPVCGAVYAPALQRLWVGGAEGAFSMLAEADEDVRIRERRQVHARPRPERDLVAVASRSHLDPDTQRFLEDLPIAERRSIGSSLKFCLVAEGEADVYPRFGPTMEWDTAAGHAVLLAAGGRVVTADQSPLRYGKTGEAWRNPSFIAWGAPS